MLVGRLETENHNSRFLQHINRDRCIRLLWNKVYDFSYFLFFRWNDKFCSIITYA